MSCLQSWKLKNQIKKACRGKSEDQQKIIKFMYEERGCLKKTVSDDEFDAAKNRLTEGLDIRSKACKKLGIDEDQVKEIDPIIISGRAWDFSAKIRAGKDKYYRTSAIEETHIFSSDNQIFAYTLKYDFLSGEIKERGEEFFYKDIVNFKTEDIEEKIKSINKTIKSTQFVIVVPGDAYKCSMIPNSATEDKISGLKAKLREKKGN